MSTIATRIRRLRGASGLDERAAADLAGLSQATWRHNESGARSPKVGEIVGIAVTLGCLTSTILGCGEMTGHLTTATRNSEDAIDPTAVAEDLQFLLEAETELHAAGYFS